MPVSGLQEPAIGLGVADKQARMHSHLVEGLRAFYHAREWAAEPVLELGVAGKHVRHKEMHQAPQLHKVVLQGRACAAIGKWVQIV